MTKEKELVKNTAIITIGKICTQFIGFFLLPLYTSVLTTSEYGTVDLATTFQQLLLPIVFFQMEQAAFRFLVDARHSEEDQVTLQSTAFLFWLFQVVALGMIFLNIGFFLRYKYLWNLYFYVICAALSGFVLQIARGLGKNTVYAAGSFLTATSIIVCNILFLVVYHFGVKGMLSSFAIGNLIGSLYVFLRLKLYKNIRLKAASLDKLRECLTYSVPLIPNNLAWWVMGASDKMIVSTIMGVSFNGLLSVSHKFPTAFTSAFTIFNLSWTESSALHINDADRDAFFTKVINTIYNLFASAAIGIVALMPMLFPIMVPNPDYRGAYVLIPIYMLAAVFNVIQGLYSVVYIGLKKTKEIAKTTVVGAFLNLVVCLTLIKPFGLYAAGISSVVGYGTNALWRYFDLKKYINAPLDRMNVILSAAVALIVCVIYYLNITYLNIAGLLIAVVYALYINRRILRHLAAGPKKFMSGITKGEN